MNFTHNSTEAPFFQAMVPLAVLYARFAVYVTRLLSFR
jgi:hypothetical protein